jgi:hypothetical protein
LSNVQKILDQFGKQVTKLAKKNVHDRKIGSSGDLRKSIKYEVDDEVLSISMEDYGVLRDAGQLGSKRKILKGWNKSIFLPRGKGFTTKAPPTKAIQKWIRTKPIRSDIKLKSLAFLISRKIKREGIVPGLFLSDAWNKEFKDLPDEILEGFSLDIDDML